uniref:N-acetyltransferase domain-containing protein n=1 Tax=Steinernema glaseri TaxID=37863 RepID=A0A1I7YIG5_9BILA
MVQLNAYHQPIGPSLPHWQARPQPARCVLHGKYCRLEAVNPAQHGDSLYEAYSSASDGRDWTYLSVEPFTNRAQFDQHLQTISQASNAVHYAVVEQATGRALGTLSLMRIDPQNGCIEVGFVAWSPALKQTRMATEAHYLLMAYAIDGLGYRRYEWKCDTHNAPSQAAARRLGFRYEGRQKHRLGQQLTVAPTGPGARRLKQMLALQAELNQLIDPDWRVAKQDYYRAIWVECAELANYLDWKWWQHSERNLPQLQLELIDILHFGLCDVLRAKDDLREQEAATALNQLQHAPAIASDSAIIMSALERFTSRVLETRQFDFSGFAQLASLCGLTLDTLYHSYAGKNALNRLRQLRGYQHGHYHKQWGGQQDNEHLALLQSRLPTEQDNYPELILHALQDSYDTFFSGGTPARNGAAVPPPLSSR